MYALDKRDALRGEVLRAVLMIIASPVIIVVVVIECWDTIEAVIRLIHH
jgi:hypothetical protein